MIERCQLNDDLQRRRVDGERKEGGREQEHRLNDQLHDVEVLPAAHEGRERRPERGEREPDQDRSRHSQHRPPRLDEAEREHEHDEPDRVEAAARHGPDHLAERDLLDAHRRRDHGVESLGVTQLVEEVEGRLVDGAVHGRGRQQRGSHENRIAHRMSASDRDVPHQRAEPKADAKQVEDRLEEA